MKRFIPFIFAFLLLFSLIPFSVSASDISCPSDYSTWPSGSLVECPVSPSFSYHSSSDFHNAGFDNNSYINYQFYYAHPTSSSIFYSVTVYFWFNGPSSDLVVENSGCVFKFSSSNSSSTFSYTYSSFRYTYTNSVLTEYTDATISHSRDSHNVSEIIYNSNSNEFYFKLSGQWYKVFGFFKNIESNLTDFSPDIITTTSTPETITETTTTTIKDFGEEQLNVSNSILDNVKSLLSSIINLPSKIAESIQGFFITLGNTIIEKLEYLFIPSGDNLFSDVKDIISEKFGIFNQLFDLAGVVIHYEFSDEPPNFNITLYGHTITIVDWELFSKYRLFIHGIIIFIAYYFFIQRLIKRIPQIIRGI